LNGGISKKDSTQSPQWAYFQGFAPPEPLAEFPVATKNVCAKPLKIRTRTPDTLDAALRSIPGTGYHPSHLSGHSIPDLQIIPPFIILNTEKKEIY